jgi:signal peptidase
MEVLTLVKREKSAFIMSKVVKGFVLVICVVLAAFVIVNITLIVKSYVNPDEVPDFMGYKPFIVLSGSMEPVILAGDMVLTREVGPEDIRVGDIISFSAEDRIVVTHRVVDIDRSEGLTFITKGDANVGTDAVGVKPEQIEGRYIGRAANMGRFALFIQTPAGMLLFVITPMCLFILYDIIARSIRTRRSERAPAAVTIQGGGMPETPAGPEAAVTASREDAGENPSS